jgi:FkbM family methyltransferase
MADMTYEELHEVHERIVLGLQYTIAQRERLTTLWRMISKMLTEENGELVAQIMKSLLESPAERFQDVFAILISGGKRNGYFVEFGACDGVAANNTLTLEQNFGWAGLLAEPGVFWHERLLKNRTAAIDTRCVSDTTGGELEFFQSAMPGNSSTHSDHPYLGEVVDCYKVPTVTLADLLKEHNAPKYIDFLSVDTEGHEMEVFTNFDFKEYKFGFICVEQHPEVRPEDDLRPLLERAGYRVMLPRDEGRPVPMQITGIDVFFVPKDSPWAGWQGK